MPTSSSSAKKSRLGNALAYLGFFGKPADSERRQHVRHSCSFPVTVRVGSGDREQTLAATARDLSIGGMLIEGADLPEGVIRVQLQFDVPADVLKDEDIARSVTTSAAIRYRDKQSGTLSLAFAEPLRPADAARRLSSNQWILLLSLLPVCLLVPVAFYFTALAKYLAVWTAGYLTTLLLTPLIRSLALRAGVVDVPDERRTHRAPTPRGGGLAVVVGFYGAALLALLYPWESSAGSLNTNWLYSYLVGSSVLVLVGLVDDIRGLRPMVKLSGQMVAASLMFVTGNGVGRLLGFDLPLPLDFLVTLFWFVALTNAFNLIDGLDGLAAGLALIAGIGLMGAFFIRRMPSDALVMLGLAGACVAFLRYNFHPASIFLGDTGSMFLGFTFASIAIATGSKGTFLASLGVPLLAVGIPVFDTILAIWRRSVRAFAPAEGAATHRGLMQPDAEHLHHRLRRRGLNQYQIAVLLYVINGLLVLTGLLSLVFRDQALGVFLVAFVAGAYVVMRHLAEVELWDTGRALIRGLSRPQQKVAAFFFYPAFDVICLVVSLGAALAMVQLIHPVHGAWDRWIRDIPIWVAPVFLMFCASRVYSRVWSLARTNDYLLLSVSLLASTIISLGVSILLHPELWKRYFVLLFIFTGIAHVLLVGSRMALRGLVDALALWSEKMHYRRGGVVRRVLLYGSGSRCLLYLRERALNTYDTSVRRMIIGLLDDDTNLRFRYVGGYVVLGTGQDLPELINKHRVDEIVITAQLTDEALTNLVALCALNGVRLSEWHYEERVISAPDAPPNAFVEQSLISRSGAATASDSARAPSL